MTCFSRSRYDIASDLLYSQSLHQQVPGQETAKNLYHNNDVIQGRHIDETGHMEDYGKAEDKRCCYLKHRRAFTWQKIIDESTVTSRTTNKIQRGMPRWKQCRNAQQTRTSKLKPLFVTMQGMPGSNAAENHTYCSYSCFSKISRYGTYQLNDISLFPLFSYNEKWKMRDQHCIKHAGFTSMQGIQIEDFKIANWNPPPKGKKGTFTLF